MLNREECMNLLNETTLRYENIMTLHCKTNILEFHGPAEKLRLNESQKRLFICLLKKIRCKREIMNVVWYENHQNLSDNNYHQLIFQTRALLRRSGLPPGLLVTIHYVGVILNEHWLSKIAPEAIVRIPETSKDHSWLSRLIIRVSSL